MWYAIILATSGLLAQVPVAPDPVPDWLSEWLRPGGRFPDRG